MTHEGFRKESRTVNVLLGPPVSVNVGLEIANASTTVTVTEEARTIFSYRRAVVHLPKPSDFDVRHAFKAAFTYNIPAPLGNPALHAILKNWSIASIYTVKTALPVNVTVGRGDVGFDPSLFVTRPDLVPKYRFTFIIPPCPGGEESIPRPFLCRWRSARAIWDATLFGDLASL